MGTQFLSVLLFVVIFVAIFVVVFVVMLGYLAESFLLSWGERESDGQEQAVPLAPRSTQTLFELGMEGDKRYYLYLLDGPDAPPVKDAGGQGAESGAGQTIGLATSVNTSSPSSHSLNNVSSAAAGGGGSGGGASSGTTSSWSSSSYSYSNKSDTGGCGHVMGANSGESLPISDEVWLLVLGVVRSLF